jgi:hypothetical protein
MPVVIKRRQCPKAAAGSDVPSVVGQPLPRVEQLREMHRVETEEAAALGDIGQQIVRRAVADGAGRSGRLLMFLSSNTACVRQVVWRSKSCSQRMPPMLRQSWRPEAASSAVWGIVAPAKPLARRHGSRRPILPSTMSDALSPAIQFGGTLSARGATCAMRTVVSEPSNRHGLPQVKGLHASNAAT